MENPHPAASLFYARKVRHFLTKRKKTLRNFRGLLEERLLRWENEKAECRHRRKRRSAERKGCSRMKTRNRKNYVIIGEFLEQRAEIREKIGGRMRIEKGMAALGLAMLLGMTGCAGEEPVAGSERTELQEDETPADAVDMPTDVSEEDKMQEELVSLEEREPGQTAEKNEEPSDGSEKNEESSDGSEKNEESSDGSDQNGESPDAPDQRGQSVAMSPGTEHLGGKVQEPRADGMMFAQTTLLDKDGSVTLLDVEEAKKIPVQFTEDTKVEYWTIEGGGAGIDMQDAAVSDLREGMSVELEGYYDGETFVATRVIIEEYRS